MILCPKKAKKKRPCLVIGLYHLEFFKYFLWCLSNEKLFNNVFQRMYPCHWLMHGCTHNTILASVFVWTRISTVLKSGLFLCGLPQVPSPTCSKCSIPPTLQTTSLDLLLFAPGLSLPQYNSSMCHVWVNSQCKCHFPWTFLFSLSVCVSHTQTYSLTQSFTYKYMPGNQSLHYSPEQTHQKALISHLECKLCVRSCLCPIHRTWLIVLVEHRSSFPPVSPKHGWEDTENP
jgi:hypothetical protein